MKDILKRDIRIGDRLAIAEPTGSTRGATMRLRTVTDIITHTKNGKPRKNPKAILDGYHGCEATESKAVIVNE
jgi:hypothetical protein